MFKTYYESGDIVVCKDISGPSCLVVKVGKQYVIEKVLEQCYIKLVGVEQIQKMWRFKLKGKQ